MSPRKYQIGIDEAGRGPLAGPIAVAGLIVYNKNYLKLFSGVRDSKQLSEKQREEWYETIRHHQKSGKLAFAVSFCEAKTIDKYGLTQATKLALNRALCRLDRAKPFPDRIEILLDGLLKAPRHYENQKTIIDGDAKERIIALASICAKVVRDRRMKRLALRYPKYGFAIHKGYGTRDHYLALEKYGLCQIHRRLFLSKILKKGDTK